jgi:enterochelin esterase-like enzyme
LFNSKRIYVFWVTALLVLFCAACDPLATEAQPVTIQITATPIPRTRPPTVTPPPSETPVTPKASVTPQFACNEPTGQVVKDSFQSAISKKKVDYSIYLPPCFWATGKRYPYVILMHGSDVDDSVWTQKLKIDTTLTEGIQKGKFPPMVLIMPDGDDIANQNIFRENASYESLILKELIPTVELNLCVWQQREGRAIGGISRGGFWAFLIGFRHPQLFSAVGGHSAFFDDDNAPNAYNPLDLANDAVFPPGQQPRIWLDAGKDDYARPNIEVFRKRLEARQIDPGYHLYPIGQHNLTYWASHISDYLEFYGAVWPRNLQELPACAV